MAKIVKLLRYSLPDLMSILNNSINALAYVQILITHHPCTCRRNVVFSVSIPKPVFVVLRVLSQKFHCPHQLQQGLGSGHSIQIRAAEIN